MESFNTVFRDNASFVGRVLSRCGVAQRDLPDASQDVFLVVLRRLDEFEGRASIRTWLYRIAMRVASDYRKRAHRRYESLEASPPQHLEEDGPAQALATRQLVSQLESALHRLKPDKRHVFVLYELEELSMQEVAHVLGCPLKTAFSRLYAARQEVRAWLRSRGVAGCALMPVHAPLRWRDLPTTAASPVPAAGGWLSTSAGSLAVACALAMVIAPHAAHLSAPAAATLAELPGQVAGVHSPSATRSMRYEVMPTGQRPPPVAPALPVHRRTRRATSGPSAAVVQSPQPTMPTAPAVVGDWVRAPEPVAPAASTKVGHRYVGLGEVLAVTSVRPTMRLGLANHLRENWELVPSRQGTSAGNDASPAAGSSPARRASTRR